MRLVESRYSCRAYDTARPVAPQLLDLVLEAARLAPSACNRQPWTFLIADTEEQREAIMASYTRDWIRTAPDFIVACGHHPEAWHRPCDGKDHTDVDVSIAVEHICLAAAAAGLGTCWVCNFDPKPIIEAFALPEGVEPIAIIPIGYPAPGSTVPMKSRKDASAVVRRGKY